GTDGANPVAALVEAMDGNFYGTTPTGGSSGAGIAFKITPGGAMTILHAFTGGADGANPMTSLIQATDGNLYGTTKAGGASNHGTAFKMTPAGTFTRLHSFMAGSDGLKPVGALVQGADGNFYGTTQNGGSGNRGTVFKITPTGLTTILHSFSGGADGFEPLAALVQAPNGTLFGT